MIRNTMLENGALCPLCGKGKLEDRLITERYEYGEGSEKVMVVAENLPVRVCPVAGCETTISNPEAARIHHDAICRALGLLTHDQVRDLRESFGLTQGEFAQLTGIGEATISRWERGLVIQNRAMDNYLRLLARDPGSIRHLRELKQPAAPPPKASSWRFELVVGLLEPSKTLVGKE
jgi:putative zinc finger/helix-turn-helix YgiT family protein